VAVPAGSEPIFELPPASDRNCVIYFANQHADLLTPFVRHLRQEYGIDTILTCKSRNDLPKDGRSGFDAAEFAVIVEHGSLLAPHTGYAFEDAKALAEQVRQVEQRLGINLLDILRTDRHFGIGFVTGARFMRSTVGSSIDYGNSIAIVLQLVHYFEALLCHFKPCMVLGGFGPIAGASLLSVANGLGIPVRWPLAAKVGKGFYWAADRHLWPPNLQEEYRLHLAAVEDRGSDETARLERPYGHLRILQQTLKKAVISSLARTLFNTIARAARERVARRRPGYGGYFLRARLRHQIEQWWWLRRAVREAPLLPRLPQGLPFVFYPLMVEPESSIMSEAQTADNQLVVIDWLSKTAPTGWYVLVKEHPGRTSPRPRGFWERIRGYPNVLVAAPFEDMSPVLERAGAVATINGTVGVQAAVAGTPVITFHRGFLGLVMPHVFLAESYVETRQAMEQISTETERAGLKAERRNAGRAFLSALEACSFPVEHEGLLVGVTTGTPVPQHEASRMVDQLIVSLDGLDAGETPIEATSSA